MDLVRAPAEKYGQKWSVEETIVAFFYYCQIPFGRITKSNPEVIRIAALLGRTPSSVALKMGNLGHFDPELQKRNILGLSNASKTDLEVVTSFYNNWEGLAEKAREIERTLSAASGLVFPEGATRDTTVAARVNQHFFRDAVLASYQHKCCITEIDVPALLIASHIKPWADSDPMSERTNPSNGLCLNALHDRAFDKGLITVLPDYTVRVSSKLKDRLDGDSIAWLMECDKQPIHLPDRFLPGKEFLQYHNDVIFVA